MGRYVAMLARGLTTVGHSVVVATRGRYGLQRISREPEGTVVIRAPDQLETLLRPADAPDWLWATQTTNIDRYNEHFATEILSALRELRWTPDVVQCHNWMTFPAARRIGHTFDIPVVSTVHILYDQYRLAGFPLFTWQKPERDITRAMLRESTRIIVVSESTRRLIVNRYPDAAPVDLVRTGITIPNHVTEPGDSAEDIVLFVGRLTVEKGAAVLTAAAPIVYSRLPTVKFLFVGDGPLKEVMQQNRSLPPGTILMGWLPHSEVMSLYSRVSVVVIPSFFENCPLVALEAMSFARPVIGLQTDGMQDIIQHGRTGELVPMEVSSGGHLGVRPALLAEAILRVLRDKSYAGRLGKAARQYIQAFHSEAAWINATCNSLVAAMGG